MNLIFTTGNMAAQNANAVAITGGTISGVTINGATINGGTVNITSGSIKLGTPWYVAMDGTPGLHFGDSSLSGAHRYSIVYEGDEDDELRIVDGDFNQIIGIDESGMAISGGFYASGDVQTSARLIALSPGTDKIIVGGSTTQNKVIFQATSLTAHGFSLYNGPKTTGYGFVIRDETRSANAVEIDNAGAVNVAGGMTVNSLEVAGNTGKLTLTDLLAGPDVKKFKLTSVQGYLYLDAVDDAGTLIGNLMTVMRDGLITTSGPIDTKGGIMLTRAVAHNFSVRNGAAPMTDSGYGFVITDDTANRTPFAIDNDTGDAYFETNLNCAGTVSANTLNALVGQIDELHGVNLTVDGDATVNGNLTVNGPIITGDPATGSNIIIGQGASATASTHSIAIGSLANAGGVANAIALGQDAQAVSDYSIAIGRGSRGLANYGVAAGYLARATGTQSVSIGAEAWANGNKSTSIGYFADSPDSGLAIAANGVNVITADAAGLVTITLGLAVSGQTTLTSQSTTATTLVVKQAASQSGSAQEWRNSSGVMFAKVWANNTGAGIFELNGVNQGGLVLQHSGAPASQQCFYIRSRDGAFAIELLNDTKDGIIRTPLSINASSGSMSILGPLSITSTISPKINLIGGSTSNGINFGAIASSANSFQLYNGTLSSAFKGFGLYDNTRSAWALEIFNNGMVSIPGGLTTYGATTLDGEVTVNGNFYCWAHAYIDNGLEVNGLISSTGNIEATGDLAGTNLSLLGGATVNGSMIVSGGLETQNGISLTGGAAHNYFIGNGIAPNSPSSYGFSINDSTSGVSVFEIDNDSKRVWMYELSVAGTLDTSGSVIVGGDLSVAATLIPNNVSGGVFANPTIQGGYIDNCYIGDSTPCPYGIFDYAGVNATLQCNGVATFGDVTTFNGVTVFNNVIQQSHALLTYASTISVSFHAQSFRTINLTGDVIFTSNLLGVGKSVTLRLICDGTARNLTFPSGWKFIGSGVPASLAAGKIAILTLTSFSTTDANVVAAYSAET